MLLVGVLVGHESFRSLILKLTLNKVPAKSIQSRHHSSSCHDSSGFTPRRIPVHSIYPTSFSYLPPHRRLPRRYARIPQYDRCSHDRRKIFRRHSFPSSFCGHTVHCVHHCPRSGSVQHQDEADRAASSVDDQGLGVGRKYHHSQNHVSTCRTVAPRARGRR